ncbi:hypothetical protein MCACP_07260 [Neomoorella carbonis]
MGEGSSWALAYAPVGRLLWRFSWPAIVGMMCNALYNVIDRIFVGLGVGTLAIAAVTVAFPLMTVLLALSLLIGVGATALISIRLGENKRKEAEVVAANAAGLLVLLPLSFSIVYLSFPEPLLRLFGASAEVMPYALDFMHIIILGSVFGSLGMGMNNFIRAEGNPIMAMSTQVLGTIINAVLNYIFIFHLGMGIKGSALATGMGQLFRYGLGFKLLFYRPQPGQIKIAQLLATAAHHLKDCFYRVCPLCPATGQLPATGNPEQIRSGL